MAPPLLVREFEFADQPLHAARFLERLRFSLWMFSTSAMASADDRHLANERRDFLETGDFRRAPAPLAAMIS